MAAAVASMFADDLVGSQARRSSMVTAEMMSSCASR